MFRYRLALALHRTVAELETQMSMRELRNWQLFDGLHEPLPDRLLDIHLAHLASLMLNIGTVRDVPVAAAELFVIKDRAPPQPPKEREIDRLRRQWRGE